MALFVRLTIQFACWEDIPFPCHKLCNEICCLANENELFHNLDNNILHVQRILPNGWKNIPFRRCFRQRTNVGKYIGKISIKYAGKEIVIRAISIETGV